MSKPSYFVSLVVSLSYATSFIAVSGRAEDWPQLQGDALRSGNAPQVSLQAPIGLLAAIPLTDGIVAAPVVSNGKVVVIDGSGVVFGIDTATFDVVWQFKTEGGADVMIKYELVTGSDVRNIAHSKPPRSLGS